MTRFRIVDVSDSEAFGLVPPCADPRFDHRTCDYWEDAERGSKSARPAWLRPGPPARPTLRAAVEDNPFAPPPAQSAWNPFSPGGEEAELFGVPAADSSGAPADNPFLARPRPQRQSTGGLPRKLVLLDRGRGVFGSYARVLLADGDPVAYAQFGPLSAYPRALRLRELYPQLPDAPPPAVITCVASTPQTRRQGHGRRLVEAVCNELDERGFAAVEAYPDLTRSEDEQSGGRPGFWYSVGFRTAVDDERFPVMRRELD